MKISPSLARFLRRPSETAEAAPDAKPEPAVEAPVAAEPEPEPQARAEPDAEREPVLHVAPPPREPEPEPEPNPEPPAVVPLVLRDATPRVWNLWELERLADAVHGDETREERTLLLLHLRQFADASGDLPVEFDPLVRDAFGADLAVLAR